MKKNTLCQILFCVAVIGVLSLASYIFKEYIDYRIVALILLLTVSVLAVIFDIIPVLVSAVLSALILNLFFIEPILHYKINSAESALLFVIYLVVALVNAVLTNRLRKQEAKIRDKEEKEKTIGLYNTLLSSLSHELKTPIATIIGAVDILKDSGDSMSREQRIDLYSEMEIAGSRLNNQVENLLNMSRLESGVLRINSDWVDVNEMIFLVIRKVPHIDKHRVLFQADEKAPLFKLDTGLIETALYCLIQNAVRYTEEGSEIEIVASYDDDTLQLVVSDSGDGIQEEEFDLVFEKFYRGARSGSGGTGLGLSITKGLVEAHKGEVILRKGRLGGAEFSLRIPTEASYLKNLKNE